MTHISVIQYGEVNLLLYAKKNGIIKLEVVLLYMDGYIEVFSTNNIVELDLVEQSLRDKGFKVFSKGVKALEIGNVELVGIGGATVMVPKEDYKPARSHLLDTGLETTPSITAAKDHRRVLIGFGILFLLFLLIKAFG